VPALLGLILLSCSSVLVGPLFAFAEYKPLDPNRGVDPDRSGVRNLAGATAWGWIKQLRANRSLLSGLVGSGQTAQPSEGQRASAERFPNCGGGCRTPSESQKMRVKETSARYVYQVAWYVIIGAPGCRQDRRSAQLGLRFHWPSGSGPQAVRGVSGTQPRLVVHRRRCPARHGRRHTTQDSGPRGRQGCMAGFPGLLKRHQGAGRSTVRWLRSASRT
jgi:type VI secretion system protein ImpL